MTDNKDKLDKMFQQMAKSLEKDANAEISEETSYLMSYVPYGIPTLPLLECAIGRPGLPAGKPIEFFGFEHTGKTTLAYHAIAETQKMGGAALFIDTEQSFNEERAQQCGVKTGHPYLLNAGAKTVEAVYRIIENQCEALKAANFTKPFIIVVDSITGVTTEYDQAHDFSAEQRTGHEAKQIRSGMKRVITMLADLKVPCIFINHSIANIPKGPFPTAPSQSAGGHAIKFYSSVRVELINKGDITAVDRGFQIKTGQAVRFKLRKNKVNKPRLLQFDGKLTNEFGFDFTDSLLDAARYVGLVYKPASQSETAPSTIYIWKKGEDAEEKFKRDEWEQVITKLGGHKQVRQEIHKTAKDLNIGGDYGQVL